MPRKEIQPGMKSYSKFWRKNRFTYSMWYIIWDPINTHSNVAMYGNEAKDAWVAG
jgi:hypothetical protein